MKQLIVDTSEWCGTILEIVSILFTVIRRYQCEKIL